MKKNYSTTGILIVLVAGIFIVTRVGHTGYPAVQSFLSVPDAAPAATTTRAAAPLPVPPAPAAPRNDPAEPKVASPAPSPAANVSLLAGSTTYRAYIAGSESVLDLMHVLSSTTDFTFTGEDYPSLGFFVESIDGTKNANGKYWMLYVNGTSSDLGASSATIHAGDTIEWRYETGN